MLRTDRFCSGGGINPDLVGTPPSFLIGSRGFYAAIFTGQETDMMHRESGSRPWRHPRASGRLTCGKADRITSTNTVRRSHVTCGFRRAAPWPCILFPANQCAVLREAREALLSSCPRQRTETISGCRLREIVVIISRSDAHARGRLQMTSMAGQKVHVFPLSAIEDVTSQLEEHAPAHRILLARPYPVAEEN